MTPNRRPDWAAHLLALFALSCTSQLVFSLRHATPALSNANSATPVFDVPAEAATVGPNSAAAAFETFKKSNLFVEPFEPEVIALPQAQLELVRKSTARDLELFRQILIEAIRTRNYFAPGTRLMVRYSGKLISSFLKSRREEKALPERVEPKPAFYNMLADLIQVVVDQSSLMKKQKGYTKQNVDVNAFQRRTEAMFYYFKQIIDISPIGIYLKWNETRLYKGQPGFGPAGLELALEAADLYAQFRSIGYENTAFVANRLINMLRMFGRGHVPKSAALV